MCVPGVSLLQVLARLPARRLCGRGVCPPKCRPRCSPRCIDQSFHRRRRISSSRSICISGSDDVRIRSSHYCVQYFDYLRRGFAIVSVSLCVSTCGQHNNQTQLLTDNAGFRNVERALALNSFLLSHFLLFNDAVLWVFVFLQNVRLLYSTLMFAVLLGRRFIILDCTVAMTSDARKMSRVEKKNFRTCRIHKFVDPCSSEQSEYSRIRTNSYCG